MKYIFLFLISFLPITSICKDYKNEFAFNSSDTEFISLPKLDYNINGVNISFYFKKIKDQDRYNDRYGHTVSSMQEIRIFSKVGRTEKNVETLSSIPVIGQNVKSFFCINPNKKIVAFLLFSYQDFSRALGEYIYYKPRIFLIESSKKNISNISNKYLKYFNDNNNLTNRDLNYIYKFSDYNNFLKESYKISLCDVGYTKKMSFKLFNVINPEKLERIIKNDGDVKFNIANIINQYPITKSNVVNYNNIAYYLIKKSRNNEAIFILSNILDLFPKRIVAYLNIADAYRGLNKTRDAFNYYYDYKSLMKMHKKNKLIPDRVNIYLNKYKEEYD